MKLKSVVYLVFILCLPLSGSSYAAVLSTLSFTTPADTVTPTDSIDVWVTLSLDPSSEALTFDWFAPYGGLPASMIPAGIFASYSHMNMYSNAHCADSTPNGNFFNGCGPGEYSYTPAPSGSAGSWFAIENPFVMNPGESRDFLFGTFAPANGAVTPGDYTIYDVEIGFTIIGSDIDGNYAYWDASLGRTCASKTADCAFTRTVAVVPLPAALWLLGFGLIGLSGAVRVSRRDM